MNRIGPAIVRGLSRFGRFRFSREVHKAEDQLHREMTRECADLKRRGDSGHHPLITRFIANRQWTLIHEGKYKRVTLRRKFRNVMVEVVLTAKDAKKLDIWEYEDPIMKNDDAEDTFTTYFVILHSYTSPVKIILDICTIDGEFAIDNVYSTKDVDRFFKQKHFDDIRVARGHKFRYLNKNFQDLIIAYLKEHDVGMELSYIALLCATLNEEVCYLVWANKLQHFLEQKLKVTIPNQTPQDSE